MSKFKTKKQAVAAAQAAHGDNYEVFKDGSRWAYILKDGSKVEAPVEAPVDVVGEYIDIAGGSLDAQVDAVWADVSLGAAMPTKKAPKAKKAAAPKAGVEPKGEVKATKKETDQGLVLELLEKGSTKDEFLAAMPDRKNPMAVVTQVCRIKGYGYEVVTGLVTDVYRQGYLRYRYPFRHSVPRGDRVGCLEIKGLLK